MPVGQLLCRVDWAIGASLPLNIAAVASGELSFLQLSTGMTTHSRLVRDEISVVGRAVGRALISRRGRMRSRRRCGGGHRRGGYSGTRWRRRGRCTILARPHERCTLGFESGRRQCRIATNERLQLRRQRSIQRFQPSQIEGTVIAFQCFSKRLC
jgi:hypothetical protein